MTRWFNGGKEYWQWENSQLVETAISDTTLPLGAQVRKNSFLSIVVISTGRFCASLQKAFASLINSEIEQAFHSLNIQFALRLD